MTGRTRGRDPSKNLVGFTVGDLSYAMTIEAVREIINPLAIFELPNPPLAVLGVADYRDEVVPVVDLRIRFGVQSAPITRKTKWIIIAHEDDQSETGERLTALVVDNVNDVFRSGPLKPAPTLGRGDDVRGIMGVTNHDSTLVFVLDTQRFEDIVVPVDAAALAQKAGAG